MSVLLMASKPLKGTHISNMDTVSRKPTSPVRSEDGHSSNNGVGPTTPSRSQFPVYLQTSNILHANFKMTVSNCLFYAVLKAKFQKTRFFLDRGLDVNSRNDFGYNALVAALHIDHDVKREKMFRLLVRNGADPLKKDLTHGRNALSWACYLGRENEVNKLLEDLGGNIDLAEKDSDGLTALHLATHAGNVEVVKSLILTFQKYRLSVDVQDAKGMTPYVHARRLGMKEIADVLRQQGFASPSVSDSVFFKSPREWSQIGRFERQRDEVFKRRGERIKAKIDGRVVYHQDSIQEEDPVQEKLFERSRRRHQEDQPKRPRDTHSLPPNRTPDDAVAHAQSPPRAMSERGVDEIDGTKQGSRGIALSLIDLSSPEHGRIVDTFHHSQLDTTKVSEYSQMFGGIHELMTILSHEQTSSFRKPIIRRVPSVPVASSKNKSKVSTLAILLGKDKKGKISERTGKNGKDKLDAKKRKQLSKKNRLPDIRLNDRTV